MYPHPVTNVANDPTKVSGIVTQTLNEESNYVPSVTIYDSLGRVRQTQTLGTTPSGDGRLVTDTLYDSRGWTAQVTHAYYAGQLLIDPTNGLPIRSTAFIDHGYDRTPNFTIGLTNNLKYKKASLSLNRR